MRVFDLLHDHQRLLAKAALVPLEPEEAVRLATQRLVDINKAWEEISAMSRAAGSAPG